MQTSKLVVDGGLVSIHTAPRRHEDADYGISPPRPFGNSSAASIPPRISAAPTTARGPSSSASQSRAKSAAKTGSIVKISAVCVGDVEHEPEVQRQRHRRPLEGKRRWPAQRADDRELHERQPERIHLRREPA